MGQALFKQEIQDALNNGGKLIDVRTLPEYFIKAHPHSVNFPLDTINEENEYLPGDRQKPLVVHCMLGYRSAVAAEKLRLMGYVNVYDAGSLVSALQYTVP